MALAKYYLLCDRVDDAESALTDARKYINTVTEEYKEIAIMQEDINVLGESIEE